MQLDHTQLAIMKDRILGLDLEPIKFKLVVEHEYTREKVDILEKWYRRFLFLTYVHRDAPIVVSEAIDDFWHQHILDTRKYAEDCEAVFGEFLHHFPYFGLRGDDDNRALRAAYVQSLEWMKQEFGETPDEDLRRLGVDDSDPALPSLCSDCGGSAGPSTVWGNGSERPRLS